MENEKTLIYDGPYRGCPENGWVKVDYGYGRTFEGEFRNGEPFDGTMKYGDDLILKGRWKDGQLYDGKMIYPNDSVYEGKWENGRLYDGKITCTSGDVFEGKFKDGQLYDGKRIYADGDVYEGKWENGQLYDGKITYTNGTILEGKFKDGQLYDGKRIYADGDVSEGKWENGQLYDGRKTYTNGIILEGKFKDGQLYDGRETYTNGIILEGKFKDGQLYDGKRICANGDVSEGRWKNGKPLDVYEEVGLSKTKKSYCFFRKGKNNSLGKVRYRLRDDYNNVREVTVDYGEINKILNGDSSILLNTINSLDDLIRNRVIEGARSFNELRDFAKKILQDKMSEGVEKGFEGVKGFLANLILLSSIDGVEELKKTRFQLSSTREGEDSLRKEYGSLRDFLESIGIYNINSVEEDYISLVTNTIPPGHAVSVILDIKRMKELKNLQPEKSLDEAIADKKVIHCFDSSRLLGYPVTGNSSVTHYNMGTLDKNCNFINLFQQNLGSCWFHAMASTLTVLKHPEIVKKIRDGEIELYDIKHDLIKKGDRLNEFQLRQMNTIREISKKFDIESMLGNRETVDLIIYDQIKEEVKKTVLDIKEEMMGRETNRKILEIINSKKKGKKPGFVGEFIINLRQKDRKLDFPYKVHLFSEQFEKINNRRKEMENIRDAIKEKLEAENKPIVYGTRGSIDDGALIDMKFYAREKIQSRRSPDDTCEADGNRPLSFTGREKKKKNDTPKIKT
ncbi:MAG: hypothetical protein LBP39_01190 [Rickettsiales bacterium]|jgi:hypothetical protein|nr:hypothetical protein [Rickettsiales bacterium]